MVIVNLLNLLDKGEKGTQKMSSPKNSFSCKAFFFRGWIQGQRAYKCHKGKAKLDGAKTGIFEL